MIRRRSISLLLATLGASLWLFWPVPAHAQAPVAAQTPTAAQTQTQAQPPAAGEFYLQVTPSPLVTTLKPGVPTELELKIRNAGSGVEELKIEPRSFKLNDNSSEVLLDDTTPPDIAQWVSFSAANFTIKPGAWYTQKVKISLPREAGFSYSFALLISRKNNPKPTEAGRLIKGSVAVFTLVNVDRPGSSRRLEVSRFTTSKRFYEYLPTEMAIQLKNTGNSIVQPYGNIYMQRGGHDSTPITTLPVNDNRSYILPGSSRTLKPVWEAGFPVYKTTVASNGTATTKLVWDWSKVADLRIGKYTAKLVAVYNDGVRDVPIEQEVSFWVVPWKILGGLLLACLLVLFSVGSLVWKIVKLVRRKRRKSTGSAAKSSDKTDKTEPPAAG